MTLAKQFGYPEIAPEAHMQGGVTSLDGLPYWSIGRTAVALPPGKYYAAADVERLLATTAGEQAEPLSIARAALQKIAKWFDEFPSSGQAWDDGSPMSYAAAFGSNGERDYMRQVAADALAAISSQAAPAAPEQVKAAERDLCRALLACPHTINENRVVLYRNELKDGGAYAQIADRLAEAFARLAATSAAQVQAVDKHLPGWEREISTVTLTGHQLRAALDFINPDGEDDLDQLDGELTFGIVQHLGDDGNASAGLCCWNDDTDGVLPLDGDYAAAPSAAAPAAPEQVQWISVDERLPACDMKPRSFGVEVIVYPKPEKGESTAFYGCRHSDEPDFYKYGSRVCGVTHWMPLPAAPSMKTATNEGDAA